MPCGPEMASPIDVQSISDALAGALSSLLQFVGTSQSQEPTSGASAASGGIYDAGESALHRQDLAVCVRLNI